MSFLSDINKFRDKALLAASNNTNKVILDYGMKLVELSPRKPFAEFAQGYLVNNFHAALGNTMSFGASNPADMSGSGSISSIKAVLSTLPFHRKDNVVTIVNSAPWAHRANVLGWPAGQGDNGWHWSGRISPYQFTAGSINYILGKYQ